jgi:acyl-CoA hydrolase
MTSPKKKPVSESEVTMTEIVLPVHTNALNSVFGGTVMSWIDIAAAIAAQRHARRIAVTASIDALAFRAPVRLGNIVHIKASVNRVFRTSMEVGVRLDAEDPLTGTKTHTASAYLTFVALDESGHPTSAPEVEPETAAQKRRFKNAERRRASRMELAKSLRDQE